MITKLLLLIVALSATSACEDRCSRGNLVTVDPPVPIESFEVRDDHQVLWQIRTSVPRPIEFLRYGEVPSGFQQVIPPGAARPRPFVKGETLYKKTVTSNRVFDHRGVAGGPDSFCGGYYESAPRKPPGGAN